MIINRLITGIKEFRLSTDNLIMLSFIILIFISLFGTEMPFQGGSYEEIFEQETTNLSNQIIYLLLFFISLIPLLKRFERISSYVFKEKFLSLFILLCILSALWSDYSFLSIKRSFQLLVTFLVLLNAVIFLDYKQLLIPLKVIIPLYVFSNLFSCLIVPLAIDSTGAWKGIHGHKNGLAQGTYYIFLASTIYYKSGQNHLNKILKLLIYLTCVFLIFKAQSSMVIIVLALTLGYLLIRQIEKLFHKLNIGRFLIALLISFFVLSGIALLSFSADIIALVPELFGKDMSISGRDQIWVFVLSEIEKRPLLGYGFATYWIMGSSVLDIFAADFGGFKINQAHNGYLEILLQIGIVGIILFFILIIVFLYRAIRLKNDLAIIVVLSLLIINYTESILFQPKGLPTIILMLTYLILTLFRFDIKFPNAGVNKNDF